MQSTDSKANFGFQSSLEKVYESENFLQMWHRWVSGFKAAAKKRLKTWSVYNRIKVMHFSLGGRGGRAGFFSRENRFILFRRGRTTKMKRGVQGPIRSWSNLSKKRSDDGRIFSGFFSRQNFANVLKSSRTLTSRHHLNVTKLFLILTIWKKSARYHPRKAPFAFTNWVPS